MNLAALYFWNQIAALARSLPSEDDLQLQKQRAARRLEEMLRKGLGAQLKFILI
jgi:hypothetical protein